MFPVLVLMAALLQFLIEGQAQVNDILLVKVRFDLIKTTYIRICVYVHVFYIYIDEFVTNFRQRNLTHFLCDSSFWSVL